MASPRTGRSPGEERLPRWEAGTPPAADARSANRGSSVVAERKARAGRRGSSSGDGGRRGVPELVSNTLGILWIVGASLIVLLSVGFLIGAFAMVGVLRDISKARNFGTALERKDHYDEFFDRLAAAGFKVVEDKPNIVKGVTNYLWTVVPPGTDALRVFSWEHSLETNELHPASNPALLLDIELGYITSGEASRYAVDFKYNPDDKVTQAMLDLNVGYFAKGNPSGWGVSPTAPPPPIPPKFDPKKGRRAVGGAIDSDEEETEDEAAEGEEAEGEGNAVEGETPTEDGGEQPAPEADGGEDDSEPPIEVVDPDEPPAEDPGNDGGEPAPEPEQPEDDGGDATDVR